MKGQTADDKIEMVLINPGAVFGPPIGRDITGSSKSMMDQMLRGKMPMVPASAMAMVDVRDVARLHVQAMAHPEAAGLHVLASDSDPRSFVAVAQVLKDEGYKGPSTRIAPTFLLRIMALFDREEKGMLGFLRMNLSTDNSKTRQLFGWTPIPFKQSVRDTG